MIKIIFYRYNDIDFYIMNAIIYIFKIILYPIYILSP
jgi:hypothetical protein